MNFHPLSFQHINRSPEHSLMEDPLKRHGKDIVEHVFALFRSALAGGSSLEAEELRIALQQPHISLSPNAHTYQELHDVLPRLMNRLGVFLYGGAFSKGQTKLVYSESVFYDAKLLVNRELEKLRLEEARTSHRAYRIHELFQDFIEIYREHQSNSFTYSFEASLKLDPNRPYIIRMAILRDASLLEGTYEAMDRCLALMADAPFLNGKAGAEELQMKARLMREEIEVEELWNRLARN